MAKFCMYCGKSLNEGEVCTCEEAQQAQQAQAQASQTQSGTTSQTYSASSQATDMVNGFVASFKEVIISPEKGAKNLVDNGNFVISMILMAAQAVLAGIISLAYTAFHLELDFGDCFKYLILSIFFSLVLTGVTFGCSLLAATCMKGSIDPKKALNALSLRCIAILPFTVLAVPLAFLLPSFTFGMLFICELLGLFYEFFGFRAAFGLEYGKAAYMSVIVSVVYIIVFAIIARFVASDLLQGMMYSLMGGFY